LSVKNFVGFQNPSRQIDPSPRGIYLYSNRDYTPMTMGVMILDQGVMQIPLLGGFCIAFVLIPTIVSILIAVWMYQDAEKRDESGILWLIVGLLLNLIGLILWLVVRPSMEEVERKRHMRSQYQQQYPPQYPTRYQQHHQQQYTYQSPRGKPCPHCDHGMRYIQEYGRWYCDRCRSYR